jgi:HAD superfamily hydrolase (TIGR01484 family)
MPLTPLSADVFLQKIPLVATDMDGTLTREGRFTAALFQSLEALAAANIDVLVVTGRSAGWVQGLKTYLPVAGAIAENGGVFFSPDSEAPTLLTPIPDLIHHRQQLAATFQDLQTHFPQLTESVDNCFRLTDWTFDIQGLTLLELQQLERLCIEAGWGFTYSTVQCHIKPKSQDKATSLLQVLKTHFPHLNPKQIITVGDSPNDESLFNQSLFPLSVGVANVLHYRSKLTYLPTYVTSQAEGDGFTELAQLLLQTAKFS